MFYAFQVNPDHWCIDGTHLPEDSGPYHFLSPRVERKFTEIYQKWVGILKWIYYGNEEGVLFNIPGFHKPERTAYDPRIRYSST